MKQACLKSLQLNQRFLGYFRHRIFRNAIFLAAAMLLTGCNTIPEVAAPAPSARMNKALASGSRSAITDFWQGRRLQVYDKSGKQLGIIAFKKEGKVEDSSAHICKAFFGFQIPNQACFNRDLAWGVTEKGEAYLIYTFKLLFESDIAAAMELAQPGEVPTWGNDDQVLPKAKSAKESTEEQSDSFHYLKLRVELTKPAPGDAIKEVPPALRPHVSKDGKWFTMFILVKVLPANSDLR